MANGSGDMRLRAASLLAAERAAIVADWRELCQWDPMLPPDAQPAIAAAMVDAVAAAMARPQPLGWGADPEIEKVSEVFAASADAVDIAIGQLVCLREALRRRLEGRVPDDEVTETNQRMSMVIDRAIGVTATHATRRLERDVFIEPLTGLFNRRALERDLRRQVGRSVRTGTRFDVLMLDLADLGQINDRDGHLAGDLLLQQMADTLRESVDDHVAAYRFGGDDFILLTTRSPGRQAADVAELIDVAGAPSFRWAVATFPDDGDSLDALLDVADRRLLERKRNHSRHG